MTDDSVVTPDNVCHFDRRPATLYLWQGGWVAGWLGSRMAGWQGGWMAGWQGGRVAGLDGWMAGWQDGRVGRWLSGGERK